MDITNASTFLRVNVAAQRARQLMQGAAPKVETRSRKPAAIAIQEIQGDLLEAFSPEEIPEPLIEELGLDSEEESSGED